MSETYYCPFCGSPSGICPECGVQYRYLDIVPQRVSACTRPECKTVNTPIDCRCGRSVEASAAGILDFDQSMRPWNRMRR